MNRLFIKARILKIMQCITALACRSLPPGEGVVVDAKDGVYDNIPGLRNTRDIPGNYVIIDHLNGEFSILAHFKNGSVLVKEGDKVGAGDLIGQCGNSGHSNLPHLHYHLQNTSRWLDGEGLPAQFRNFYANGKFVERDLSNEVSQPRGK